MATSKNKRKNGKVVKSDRYKRLKVMAGYDLKHLMVCNVVDRDELSGDKRLIPRTLTYDNKLKKIVPITKTQEVMLKGERWKWEVHCGVICRNPDGEVYLDKEYNFLCKHNYLLSELNDIIADTLMDHFEKANPLHRLTMFWVASPFEKAEIQTRAVLAPVWHFNVLGNMLTQWEQENEDHIAVHYRAENLDAFMDWFHHQGKYRAELKEHRVVTLWWEKTGIKMQKGELVNYRKALIEVGRIEQLGEKSIDKFNPLATVDGFVKLGKLTFVDTGIAFSQLMLALDKVPACLNCIVEVRYKDGRENTIKFYHKE